MSAYNAMIDEAEDSETKSVLRKTGWMANMTKENSNLLNEVGIRVGSDDKLTLNEDTFKKANVSTLKEMFYGNDSFAAKVSNKAAGIGNSAASTEGIYTSKGSWPSSVTQMAESMISKVDGAEQEEDTPAFLKNTEKTDTKKTLTEEDRIRSSICRNKKKNCRRVMNPEI